MEIEYIRDMDELDNVQKLMVLQNAKDLLKAFEKRRGFFCLKPG